MCPDDPAAKCEKFIFKEVSSLLDSKNVEPCFRKFASTLHKHEFEFEKLRKGGLDTSQMQQSEFSDMYHQQVSKDKKCCKWQCQSVKVLSKFYLISF